MKNVKLLVLKHYNFVNDKNESVKGTKVLISHNGRTLDLSTKNDDVYKAEELSTLTCDLIVNDNLKIDITNVRKSLAL